MDRRHEDGRLRPNNGFAGFVATRLLVALVGFVAGTVSIHIFRSCQSWRFPLGVAAWTGWTATVLSLMLLVLGTIVHIKNCLTLKRISRNGMGSSDPDTNNSINSINKQNK